jgi:hypothetical protein
MTCLIMMRSYRPLFSVESDGNTYCHDGWRSSRRSNRWSSRRCRVACNITCAASLSGQQSELGDFAAGALEGVTAIAILVAAPATGGASLLTTIGGAETALGDGSERLLRWLRASARRRRRQRE